MMISGLLLRGIGFICLGIFSEFHTISISASLIGFGTAFYEPAARAVFASQPARIRKDLFTYLNLAFNSGAIISNCWQPVTHMESFVSIYTSWITHVIICCPFLSS